jgi:predicted nucleic acid-binding protein
MIFDSSSIYRAIEIDAVEKLANEKTLDLSSYELGNVIWKNISRKKISLDEGMNIINFLSKIISLMDILHIGIKVDILKIAVKNNLSYYDSSYLYASISFNDILVSEDKKLLNAAAKHGVEAYELKDI